VNAVAV